MYSYPNLIPLPAAAVRGIAAALEPFAFERIYGAWWGRSSAATARTPSGGRPSDTRAPSRRAERRRGRGVSEA